MTHSIVTELWHRITSLTQLTGCVALCIGLLTSPAYATCSNSSIEWVQKAYIAYYGRPGDPAGIAYWACRMDGEGGQLQNIIEAFGVSAEFTDRYGNLSNSELIDSIYRQMFSREPDEAGKEWYLAELESGRMNLQTITLNVLTGAQGADSTIIANKLTFANDFSNKLDSGNVFYRSIAPAKGLLELVNENTSSISKAITEGDALIAFWNNPGESLAYCDDTCAYAKDGACDDGGQDSSYSVCNLGTDCSDCGLRTAVAACNEGCRFTSDGECDDGGSNADNDLCALGSDCNDCGNRSAEVILPVPPTEPEPEPEPTDDPHTVTAPEIAATPEDAGLPETAVNIITDSKNNKAVAVNNELGEAFYVIFDGAKSVGAEALKGAVLQLADGELVSFEFDSDGIVNRMESKGTVFTYSNYTGSTVDIAISYSDGRHETHTGVSLTSSSPFNQSVAMLRSKDGYITALQEPSMAGYAIGVIGTGVGIFLCGSQAVATGGLTAPIAAGCASAVIGFVSVYTDNSAAGYSSAGIDLISGALTRDPSSIATGIAGVLSGVLNWKTEETELKVVISGEIYTTNGKGMIREDNAETWIQLDSSDGDASYKVKANSTFSINRKLGPGSHKLRVEAKGYVIKEYTVAVTDDTVKVAEIGSAPGEADEVRYQISPTSITKPVRLYLIPELVPAPKITGHVVWPRLTSSQSQETERVKGGMVWLEAPGSEGKAAWFTYSYVSSSDAGTNGAGYYEMYLPFKSGNYTMKLKQSMVCFQNVDIPITITGSQDTQSVSFDVPKAAFRDAETKNFTFDGDASMEVDIPVVSVYDGSFEGQVTPDEPIVQYTYPYEDCSGESCVTTDIDVTLECESFGFTLNLESGAGNLESNGETMPIQIGQCGEVDFNAYGVFVNGSLWKGGTLIDRDMEPGASRDTGCNGKWRFPQLEL